VQAQIPGKVVGHVCPSEDLPYIADFAGADRYTTRQAPQGGTMTTFDRIIVRAAVIGLLPIIALVGLDAIRNLLFMVGVL
jgi:hypothetical protein